MKEKKILIWGIVLGIVVVVILIAGIEKPKVEKEKIGKEDIAKEEKIFIPPGVAKEPAPEAITAVKEPEKEVEIYLGKEECDLKEFKNPKGKIYLSLLPMDSKIIGIYEFEVKEKSFKEFLVNKDCENATLSFSKDGKNVVFGSTCKDNVSQVFMADVADNQIINIRQITTSNYPNAWKIRPIFFPDRSKVTFTLMPEMSDILAESWEIYFTDLEGKEELFTNGVMPVFSPDGKYVLVLKNPGIYLFNFETNEAERVIELRDKDNNLILGQVNMMLSLSPDGKKLALSDVDGESVYIFEIQSWQPFQYKMVAQIKTNGFWNTFSPEGNYLAVQTVDIDEKNESSNPRLVIYETCSFTQLLSFPLEKYNPDSMWVSDWQ